MTIRFAGVAALAAVLTGCVLDLGSLTQTRPLEETVVMGEGGPKIAMIEVEGVITESPRSSALGVERPSLVARSREALDMARDDDDVAALLLRVNSPGGTVSASETLYHEIQRWKQRSGKPVVAYLQGLATSGGYYVAMAADEVVAHPTAITGSIGVIMVGINVSGLMERFGVADQTFTSGEFKDAGSPLRPMRAEERDYFEQVVVDLHGRFREVVRLGRPALPPEDLDPISDGRIFTARQAADLGLVDRVGHLEHAVRALEARAGLSHSRVVVYHRPSEYRENVYSEAGPGPVQVVDIDLLPPFSHRLAPGFYYIWSPAAGAP
ncbi:MAG: signal peptide peptidase SppA [Deltaproteobacteria bacterium]|nr:MAG: signal peptide peptidase SppA [Deltaproteobacteria bacterium]